MTDHENGLIERAATAAFLMLVAGAALALSIGAIAAVVTVLTS